MKLLRQKLSLKLGAAFFVVALMTTISGGFIVQSLNALVETSSRAKASHEALDAVVSIRDAMLSSEAGVYAFVLLSTPEALGPYERGQQLYKTAYVEARRLTEGDTAQAAA